MFEGYAGTGDSGFRDKAEAEAEEAFARGQFLAELGADDDRPSLTGPAGEEAEARLAELARHTVFDGRVVTDEARLRRIPAPARPTTPTEPSGSDVRTEANLSRLRKEHTDLRRTLAPYEEAVRQLATEIDAPRSGGTVLPLPNRSRPAAPGPS
ncbi:hypothetical protein OG562_41630 [Streptomyces sp. NBC_01275]|uniref:hypothetical protein n=1 Tax=Streptomyces sp. NBC_01275 TaxID=2903807 RepID=UPI00224D0457|nr:hypothetical protein [Streptomyces sp. NBC_01275]MCX4767356.1 hypothetical protein [Streptomyces sp. NBC_01275]